MEYRRLGRTNLRVSHIGLGTMTWGEQNSEREAHEQLDAAVAAGVNFIDAAEMYPVPPRPETQGLTETYIGTWLARRKRRDDVVLASKVTGRAPAMPHIRGGPILDRAHIETALHDSLQRLQTDYLDLYQVHWPDRDTNFFGQLDYRHPAEDASVPIEETLEVLGDLVRAGKIRHIGISNETPWGLHRYLELARRQNLPRVVSIQNPYSLLNRSFEVGLAEMACREHVGLLAYSPLGFGMLSGKYLDGAQPEGARLTLYERFQRYNTERGHQATRAYVDLARRHDLDPAQMALAFVGSRPFTTSTLIGATTMEQLRNNLASADLTLSEDVLAAIDAIHADNPNPCP